ncbi:unnamed protein product [Schistosoma margrebowiei]|uniref:Uncharacterized protein n=1 Tax=Schistosoma margrebowiei TaxID=48269 RepID=A0A183NBW3_9TREM|nr:unnamed protein product [Schistosoma margrebowiei]
MSIPELLPSNWLQLNIYRQDRSRNKKRKLVEIEILCFENFTLYQNLILDSNNNNHNNNNNIDNRVLTSF